MGIEFELKYAATPEHQFAILAALGGDHTPYAMETTYYDTADLDLAARHWTLRRRYENGVSVCTLKTPAGDLGRGEWECMRETIESAVLELCQLSGHTELESLAAKGLHPTCGAKFTRRAYTVPYGGSTLEVAVDAGKLFGGSREMPLCEVEVELKEGTREDAVAYAATLAQKFRLVPEHRSKFRRALDLAQS